MKNKTFIIVIIALLVILTLFFHKILFTNSSFFVQDIMFQFHPFRAYAAETVQKGDIPLWNPYIYSGMPFLANMQSAIFYPFTIFFYLFPFPAAMKCFVTVHFFLAGLFMYLLLAGFGMKRMSAFAGAVVFMLNGYMVARIQFLSILGSVIWLPLLFLMTRKMREGPGSRDAFQPGFLPAALGIAAALQFLAGHTQILVYTILFIVVYLLADAVLHIDFSRGKTGFLTPKLAIAAVIAVGISMIQFLPSFEFIRNSIRGEGIDYKVATTWSLRPGELVNLFLPFISGNPVVSNVRNTGDFWQKCFYVGIIPLILFIFSFFSKKRKLVWFMGGFLALVLFLAFGEYNPLYYLMHRYIPFFNIFRYPSSIMFLAVFILAVAVSLGLDYLIEVKNIRKISLVIVLLIIVDLFLFGNKLNPVLDKGIFKDKGDKTGFLVRNSGDSRFMLTPATENDRSAGSSSFYGAWSEMKDNLYSNINMPFHLFNAGGQDVRVKWYDDFLDAVESSSSPEEANNLLSLLGVKHIISRNKIGGDAYRLARGGRIKIYRNMNCLPRAWIVNKGRFMERKKTLDYMKTDVFAPGNEAVFEKGVYGDIEETISEEKQAYNCRINSYSPDKVEINAVLEKPGWLVLSDTWYPGWKAWVNGKREEARRVNYIMRSVNLDRGENTIKFRYVPLAFTAGAVLTVISLFILITFVFRP